MDKNQLVLYERFLTILRELTETAHSIARAEEEKAVALSLKRHDLLDGFMKKEQAYILTLQGLDQHRVRLAKSLGWESLTFVQILEKVEPVQKEYLKILFHDLEQELRTLQQSKEVAERMMNVRVYELLAAIERQAGIPYDRERKVDFEGFPHTNLCDRYG